jgi:hypothetical protein
MENGKTFRPSIGSQIILGFVWFALFILAVIGYVFQSGPVSYVVVSAGAVLVFILWIRSISIATSYDGVTYRSGFGRQSSLLWSDIGAVATTAEMHLAHRGVSAKYETILKSNTPSKGDIKIKIKVFGKRDLVEFASTILNEAKIATVDDATKAMAAGSMPVAARNWKG